MKELREYYDPRTGLTFLVNVRTGIVRLRRDGSFPPDDTAARILSAVRGRVRSQSTRSERASVAQSCGLVKVRGALGGVYWE